MAIICPNYNHKDWIYSVSKLGEEKTLYLYDLLGQELPTKMQVDSVFENKPGIENDSKDKFIERMNSRIENGMYKQKDGTLVPITNSYNPETWWMEKQEGLVTFKANDRIEEVFTFNNAHSKAIELNKKYRNEGYLFSKEQIVFPNVKVAKSKNPSPNNRKIWRIKVTKPLIREVAVGELFITEKDIQNSVDETRDLVYNTFKKLTGKSVSEIIDVVNNLEISNELKTLLNLFASKLEDNPTLKIVIDNTLSPSFADYEASENIITLYSLAHLNQKSPTLNSVGISLVHELLHAYTKRALFNNYTEKEKDFANTIERLFSIAKKQSKFKNDVAYESAEEWLAYVLSSPLIIKEAMQMKLNVWQRIMTAIWKLFGVNTTVYDSAFKTVFEYISNNDTFKPDIQYELKTKRSLEEDVYLNDENLTHKEIWQKLNDFANQFEFNIVDHTYTHIKSGQKFNSVTEMLSKLRITSGKLSEDSEIFARQIKNRERGGNIGTVIHGIAEASLKQTAIDIARANGYEYEFGVVTKIEQILKQFKRPGVTILSEILVADVDLLLAGTIDMIVIDENNQVHIYDFKSKEKGYADYLKKTKFGGSQLMSDKERHSFQVSAYKDMFEKMTGLTVTDMNIITLKPTIAKDSNIITDINLDKTHSSTGIVTIDYNYGVNSMYSVLKINQGKSIRDDFEEDKVDSETRKELDEALKERANQLLSSNKELTAKEEIVNKSIRALIHKKEVLYRTGKKHEIAGQEKLIDDLLDEKDVEKQLIRIIEYANSSSLRIWNEYNRYKKEGRELPLNILYGWRDSVSAFNALVDEEEGLERLLTKEFGFTDGPKYRDTLKKTIQTVAQVKSLYVTEGMDQLVDFLAPFYNRIYAEKRLAKIKEYRRKKFKGEISDNITEVQYVDNYINENEETLQKETKDLIRKELKKASRDVGLLTRWLDNLLDTKDPVTAAMVKAFVFTDEEARLGALEKRDEMVSLVRKMEEWYKKQGRIPKSNEEFYDFMLEKLDNKLSGHYITSYTSEMMREYRDIISASRDLETSEQRKAFIQAWLDDNMPLDKINFKNSLWTFINQEVELGHISEVDYNHLYDNDNYATNKLSIGEMTEKGIISFETGDILGDWLSENTWDFRMSIDKWVNPQHKQLQKILDDKNDPRGDFYRYIVQTRREADSSLPFGFRLDTRLPGVIKQNHERVDSGQSIGTTIRGAMSRELTFKIDDIHRIHEELTDEANNAKYFLPIHFTGRVTKEVTKINNEGEEYTTREFDEDEQSFDVATIYHKYWSMANDYNAKSDILPKMELTKFMINRRLTVKRDSFGNSILQKRKRGNVDLPDEESTINNSMLAEQVNDWFLSCVYGVQEKDAGKIGNVDIGKLLNTINSYTSLNLLGLNVVAGTANIILGETMQRIESFAHEYMTPGDFFYADKFYLRSMKGMVGDIGARDTTGLGSHIVEYFGIFDDYGKSDMDRRSKVGQLFQMDTLYATSHIGEHYMQSRFLFGLLANKRALNSKGEDIGRMIDMYELKNNKLVLKKEVDIIKSKWEERNILEFKSKSRGILSRLHGEYGALGKVAIQRMAIGRMAYLFRHFVVPGFRRRWAKNAYIERLGQFAEGNYITTGRFVGALGSKVFGKTEENKEDAFFGRLIGNLQSLKLSMFSEEWQSLTDHEKANIHRTLYEVGFLILAIVMANVLGSLKPEPDDDEEWKMKYWSFVAYQTYRLQNELLFFSPNLTSSMSILRSPAASMSLIENLIKLTGQIFDPTAVYESGAWKGRPKILKTVNDMAPITKQWYRLQDMSTQIPWMQKSGFGGKKKDEETTIAP